MSIIDTPWEHPDWYDLHDTSLSAGSEREPEHYRECILSMPPLDRDDHLVDLGCGTGKLAAQVARAYPRLGRVTLLEPNEDKLARAEQRLRKLLPEAEIQASRDSLGEGHVLGNIDATVATVGSVFMIAMELRDGTLADSLAWLRAGLADVRNTLRAGASAFLVETTAPPWATSGQDAPSRRLSQLELRAELQAARFHPVECVYRFRDRVVFRATRPAG